MKEGVESKLWNFAISLYEYDAISKHCLALQDEYEVNINILLWCVWCGLERRLLNSEMLSLAESSIKVWHKEVVAPLREVRRAMKSLNIEYKSEIIDDCRERIKMNELMCERVELNLLAQLNEAWGPQKLCVLDNVRCYLKKRGVNEGYVQKMLDILAKFLKKLPQ